MSGRLAVFDCDGTLIDGQAAICDAMEAACRTVGIACPPRKEIRRIVGLSLTHALRKLVPYATDEQREDVLRAYKMYFFSARSEGRLHEPLFDGMLDLLERLRDAGWQLAVATGKSDRGLHAVLETFGIREHFVSLQTADRHPSKPHPAMLEAALFEAAIEPQHAVMIGDTTFDMDMARAAGVRAVGVDWGYHEAHELLDAGAVGVAGSIAELEALLHE